MLERRKFVRNEFGESVMAERRKYVRFDTILPILYCVLDRLSLKVKSEIKDLSRDGLRISSSKALDKGTLVEIEIRIPGERINIVAFSEVIWSRRLERKCFDTGMRFTSISSDDRTKLLSYAYDEWIKAKKSTITKKHPDSDTKKTDSIRQNEF